MKKGFATSAILYTLLLLFMAVMVGILSNLENKKTILDALKQDTINALEQDTMIDAILDQIGIINQKISDLSENVYTKQEIDSMFHSTVDRQIQLFKQFTVYTQEEMDERLDIKNYPVMSYTTEALNIRNTGLALQGGVWTIETFNIEGQNVYQLAKRSSGGAGIMMFARSSLGGSWQDWHNLLE